LIRSENRIRQQTTANQQSKSQHSTHAKNYAKTVRLVLSTHSAVVLNEAKDLRIASRDSKASRVRQRPLSVELEFLQLHRCLLRSGGSKRLRGNSLFRDPPLAPHRRCRVQVANRDC
jgi:phage anti-repressor protein